MALLEIQGKEFQLTPIPLRTTRPFVIGDVILSEAADNEGLDVSDTMEITKFLKAKVALGLSVTGQHSCLFRSMN